MKRHALISLAAAGALVLGLASPAHAIEKAVSDAASDYVVTRYDRDATLEAKRAADLRTVFYAVNGSLFTIVWDMTDLRLTQSGTPLVSAQATVGSDRLVFSATYDPPTQQYRKTLTVNGQSRCSGSMYAAISISEDTMRLDVPLSCIPRASNTLTGLRAFAQVSVPRQFAVNDSTATTSLRIR